MKHFRSIEELKLHLEENYRPLTTYEYELIEEWREEGELTIFESEAEALELITEDLTNNDVLEYIKTETLMNNLNKGFEELTNKSDLNNITAEILNLIKDASVYGATKYLQLFIEVDGVAEDILKLDGVGHYFNRYDGKEIELTPLENIKDFHLLTLT